MEGTWTAPASRSSDDGEAAHLYLRTVIDRQRRPMGRFTSRSELSIVETGSSFFSALALRR